MKKVSVTKTIQVPATKAWGKLRTFREIETFSPIAKSVTEGEGPGATRTCYMPDGAEIYERLNKVDDATMEFQYEITEGPFPIEAYVSDVVVKAIDDNTCEITWACDYTVVKQQQKKWRSYLVAFTR